MRLFYFLVMFFICNVVYGQQQVIPFDKESQKVVYERVFNVYGRSPEEIRKYAMLYLKAIKDIESVDSNNDGYVSGYYKMSFNGCKSCCVDNVYFTAKIYIRIKQARTKIEITEITFEGDSRLGTNGTIEMIYKEKGCKTYTTLVSTLSYTYWGLVSGYHDFLKMSTKNKEDW